MGAMGIDRLRRENRPAPSRREWLAVTALRLALVAGGVFVLAGGLGKGSEGRHWELDFGLWTSTVTTAGMGVAVFAAAMAMNAVLRYYCPPLRRQ